MNKVIIIGNIASDIELKTTQSGVAKCNFRVAVQRRFKNSNGEHESDFFPVVAWRSTGEFISKYFSKGSKIALEGTLQTRSYQAQDGSNRYVTEIIAEQAEFAGDKRERTGNAAPAAAQTEFTEVDDAELPF
nr:MAG TPA: Single strand binding protein [Caudoviricetes sp.]